MKSMRNVMTVLVVSALLLGAAPAVGATAPGSMGAPLSVRASGAYIDAVHEDLLGRLPTDAERSAAVGTPLDSVADRARVARRLTDLPEWSRRAIDGRYQDLLDRPADPGGLDYWTSLVTSGRVSIAMVAASLAASTELSPADADPETWVLELYARLLGRDGSLDPAGVAYWTGVERARGRIAVAYAFVQSPESCRRQVTTAYHDLLGRAPDPDGLTFWAEHLKAHGAASLDVQLASSVEYLDRAVSRFGEPPSVPAAPTGVSAVPQEAAVVVSWTPPAEDPRAPTTGYVVTSRVGGHGCSTTTATQCTVTGLDRGTSYDFRVVAANDVGAGTPSSFTNFVVPDRPLQLHASAYFGDVDLWWDIDPLDYTDSEPISQVRIIVRHDGATVARHDIDFLKTWRTSSPPVTIGGRESWPSNWGVTLDDLDVGVPYTFTMTLIYGSGEVGTESSPTQPVELDPPVVPHAPVGVGATPGDGQALVIWTLDHHPDDWPITGFRVVTLAGGVEVARQDVSIIDAVSTSGVPDGYGGVMVDGLTNGTAYQFAIIATSDAGDTAPSEPSAAVVPAASG
jgi:hypothetical protein